MTERHYTEDQVRSVRRIMSESCFYGILGVSKEAGDPEVKRAYRKIALEVHPDKNRAPHAEDAFKKVSAAYSCLIDPEKKRRYDLSGGDTRDMYSANPNQGAGGGHQRGGGGYYYEGDVDPEEIFRMFFGGFSPFGDMQQARRRQQHREPHGHRHQEPAAPQNKLIVTLIQLLPIILIILSSSSYFFQTVGKESYVKEPEFVFFKSYAYPVGRQTNNLKVPYFVSRKFQEKSTQEVRKLEPTIEQEYFGFLREKCAEEQSQIRTLRYHAQNSYSPAHRRIYQERLNEFQAMHCQRLQDMIPTQ